MERKRAEPVAGIAGEAEGRMKSRLLTQEFIDKRRAERKHLQAERPRHRAETHGARAGPPKGDVRALIFDCEHGRLVERFASVEEALGHIANLVECFFGNDDEMLLPSAS